MSCLKLRDSCLDRRKARLPMGKKELGLRCNDTHQITLKTLHGEFEFRLQKYQFEHRLDVSFLGIRQGIPGQSIRRSLQELSVYDSNHMSDREVAGLVEQQCGSPVLSEQTIWQLVQQSAFAPSRQLE